MSSQFGPRTYERFLQYELAALLADDQDPDQAMTAMLQGICERLGWELGALWIHDPVEDVLRCRSLWRNPEADLDEFEAINLRTTLPIGASLPGKAWAQREPVWLADVGEDDNFFRAGVAAKEGLRSALAVPMHGRRGLLGVIEFYGREAREPEEDVMRMLSATASLIGQALGRRLAEEAEQRSEAKARALLETAPDAVITMDHWGRVVELNPGAEQVFGFRRADIVGKPVAELLIPPALRQQHERGLERFLATGEGPILGQRMEYTALRADRTEFPIEITITQLDLPGPPVFMAHIQDITERQSAEKQLAFLAYHDRLTGLPSRTMFEDVLEMALARARRNDQAVAVAYIDLDHFKMVNESLGHDRGDDLLRQVAARLSGASRETDLVARPGGDEFVLLLADLQRTIVPAATGADNALLVAETVVSRIHDALQTPFMVGSTEVFVSASVGVSIFPADAQNGRTLLKNAESAMYRSKRLGPGRYVVFPTGAPENSTALSLATRLRRAVEAHPWVVHYQPLLELSSTKVVGVEALIRWDDPERGLIQPADFIPLAEEMGLIEAIGDWLLEEVLRQAIEWRAAGLDLDVSFNLSPRQLWHVDFADRLLSHLDAWGVDPSRIVVEMTESTAMTDPRRTMEILRTLRASGVRIAIDDFGTGYSSLSRLRELPVDILKIDRSFVQDIPDGKDAGTMVSAIIQLAHSLGMDSLAEGIETEEQRAFLLERGCRFGQGFHFARPVPAEGIRELSLPARRSRRSDPS
ncbi:MAG TPA: EAL domain-containing protein [Actinomycetota bacterium]|nr:EAL domain-containing protein [Actinomycetota bacterium]